MTVLRAQRRERGAALIVIALSITVLFVILAIVIDLGATRSDRRSGQAAADNTAISAAYTLDEDGAVEACEVALELLAVNLDTGAFTVSGPSCSDVFATTCVEGVERAVTAVSGDYTARIVHPVVTGTLLENTSVIGGAATPFDATADGDPCERLGVDVSTSGDAFFGGIAGSTERSSRVGAVALVAKGDPLTKVVPAFLMLDRTACKAITTNTGTNSTGLVYPDGTQRPDGILVRSNGVQPGIIHADTDGSECGNATSDRAIWASEPSGGLKTIYVEALDASNPGLATTVAPDGIRSGGGINVTATAGDIVSRTPVDDIYQSAIASLHSEAYTALSASGQPANSNRYDCDGVVVGSFDPAFTTAYVDCGFPASAKPSFSLAETRVVFSGGVSLGSASRIVLPNATTVEIRGGLSLAGGGGADNWAALQAPVVRNMYVRGRVVVSSNSVLNIGAPVVTSGVLPTCGAAPVTSRLAVFSPNGDGNPALDVSGKTTLCATTVYLAGPRTFGAPLSRTNPTYTELSKDSGDPFCSPTLPCPWVTDNPAPGARFALTGQVVWRAPNSSSSPLSDSIPLPTNGGIEDLALWGESGEVSQVKAGATLSTSGVFVAPNSAVTFQSGNAGTEPVDAQFIARTVSMSAGLFTMRPSVANTVPIPAPSSISLIR